MKNELEGSVQGHRDGHGFVLRDDGGPDLYLPPAQMRAVLHGDRVRAAVTQFDRKGRAEGRVLSIISRPPRPLIARLVRESGVWLARPEDRRYGQDVLLEKRGLGRAREGQITVIAGIFGAKAAQGACNSQDSAVVQIGRASCRERV